MLINMKCSSSSPAVEITKIQLINIVFVDFSGLGSLYNIHVFY